MSSNQCKQISHQSDTKRDVSYASTPSGSYLHLHSEQEPSQRMFGTVCTRVCSWKCHHFNPSNLLQMLTGTFDVVPAYN